MQTKKILKSIICASLSAIMCCSVCGCGGSTQNTAATEKGTSAAASDNSQTYISQEHRKIIIDTDTGADDASALIFAA